MKTFNTLIAVTTFALSASAFALPSQQQDRFFTQAGDYQQPVAADGADRTPGGQTLAAMVLTARLGARPWLLMVLIVPRRTDTRCRWCRSHAWGPDLG
ncbi:hypothetical protein SAMN04490204_0006 [Pseudomonas thivervalensis]|nr:hypothetical protein SAMN04490204_0006 [Pseudomonas thivervalensis]